MDSRVFSSKMISNMKEHLESNSTKFITYPKFVFLCGKAIINKTEYERSNRGLIGKYICNENNNIYIVLSEKLWEDGFNSDIDLLTFEEFLAEVSDCIVLFVESPGSFCELGAFAYADKLFSDKLIVVIDNQYQHSKSFVMTGPVLKVKRNKSVVVYANLDDGGLLSSFELRNAILKKTEHFDSKMATINKRVANYDSEKININSFINELLELLKITQPIGRTDLLCLYKIIKGFSTFSFVKRDGNKFNTEIKYDYVLKLLQTVNLIQIRKDVITLPNYKKIQNLMFIHNEKAANIERNRLICRKYRYWGINENDYH